MKKNKSAATRPAARFQWTDMAILAELRKLHRAGRDLSYAAFARSHQTLLSAAAYHFKSYRKAVEKAGIDYAEVTRRPRWTKQRIIAVIKAAHKRRQDLHWGSIVLRRDELGKAAFASLQPRLFKNWNKALEAAGLKAQDIRLYEQWDRKSIITALQKRARDKKPLNSGAMQAETSGLHAAAIRYFGSYDQALLHARLQPAAVRLRQQWSKPKVARQLRKLGDQLTKQSLRKNHPSLYAASLRLFGSVRAAQSAARRAAK